MKKKSIFKMDRISYLVLGVTIIIVLPLLFAPAASISSNPCSSCHASYFQYLDIREGDGGNQIPATVGVGETKVVSVAIENLVNAPNYNVLSRVSLTLNSKNGYFSVATPVFNIGDLTIGKESAIWEIKGISAGEDSLIFSVNATNTHASLSFSDSYLPAPSITVTAETIPEFPSTSVLMGLLFATVILVVLFKRKWGKQFVVQFPTSQIAPEIH